MKNGNQSGQSLIENIVANFILLLCAFSVIEVSRLLAFKSYLQVLGADTVRQISFSQLSLIRGGVIPKLYEQNEIQMKIFEKKIKKNIEKKLNLFQTSLFSFDKRKSNQNQEFLYLEEHHISLQVSFIYGEKSNMKSKKVPGVYLKINSCLPVLFSGYFRNFTKHDKIIPQIGKAISDKNLSEEESSRNCLGYYSSSNILAPLFWFRVRSAAYFPWPASSSIYEKGFSFPNNVSGIENKYRENVFQSLENVDLSLFFNEIK
jgi:hypothetical protein